METPFSVTKYKTKANNGVVQQKQVVFPSKRKRKLSLVLVLDKKEVMDSGRTQIPEKWFNSNLSKAIIFMSLCSKISNTQIPALKTIHKIPTELSAKFWAHQQTITQLLQFSLISFRSHPTFSLLCMSLQRLRKIQLNRFKISRVFNYIIGNHATDYI